MARMRHTGFMVEKGSTFSEREFYLSEFRGRTLGIALAESPSSSFEALGAVIDELAKNGTRCVIVSPIREILDAAASTVIAPGEEKDWVGRLWRDLRGGMSVGLWLPETPGSDGKVETFAVRCVAIVSRLRLAKLVWIDGRGSLTDAEGQRISLLDHADLSGSGETSRAMVLESPADRELVGEIRDLLERGIAAVNICSLAGLADELFTYAGSGTLLTRNRYLEVRELGVDDFDAATDLIARGVDEGYLAPRSEAEVERALGNAFGVFVEGRFLAGIGGLMDYSADGVAEIVSLYTVTRFVGEGVGGHLVGYAVERARAAGYARIFACTTSPRVESFFVRQGFALVDAESIPDGKWVDYPPDRRERVRCLARAVE